MKYEVRSNGLWENAKEVKKYKEIEKAVEGVFNETKMKTSERQIKLHLTQSGMEEFNRIFQEEVNKQLSDLEQLEYLDKLSEQTI